VVTAHGGDIHIRNMPGKGCVFIVEIPLATGATAGAQASG
jgi:signal transduction histidine kinase